MMKLWIHGSNFNMSEVKRKEKIVKLNSLDEKIFMIFYILAKISFYILWASWHLGAQYVREMAHNYGVLF